MPSYHLISSSSTSKSSISFTSFTAFTSFMLSFLLLFCLLLTQSPFSYALDNGLALTPPMGFLSWERFRCTIDCVAFPKECINEDLYKTIADAMIMNGFLAAGYNYVNIDDCWPELKRDNFTNFLIPDMKRFPSGMVALSTYMQQRGLKLGIYGDSGTMTCGGYPGSYDYFETDAFTFANWGIDSLKLDGCYLDASLYPVAYPQMTKALNSTKRSILYACSWPAYVGINNTDQKSLVENCNYWRLYDDIQDSWDSMIDIAHYWGDNQNVLIPLHGPGHWNDPDMIICGDFSLSVDECRVQFALWSLWSAPLFLSSDLRTMSQEYLNIVLNPEIIAVDQDSKGEQGRRIVSGTQNIWKKTLSTGEIVVVIVNESTGGMPSLITVDWQTLGLPSGSSYVVRDLFERQDQGTFTSSFVTKVNGHSATMYKLTPKSSLSSQ